MSQLKKTLERTLKTEGPRLGFGPVNREKPRAMVLGALVRDAKASKAALEAGVDFVVVKADSGSAAASVVKETDGKKIPVGAWVSKLDAEGSKALKDAEADFVASSLDDTSAVALNPDELGHVLAVTSDMEDTTLRAVSGLSLDGLFLKRPKGPMTLQQQVELVRLSMLSSTPLLINCPADLDADELRVLRDAGAAAVVAAEGTSADELKALGERLREIPAKKSRSDQRSAPLIPGLRQQAEEEHDHEHDHDDD